MNGRLVNHTRREFPRWARRLIGGKTGIVADLLHYLPDRSDPAIHYSVAVESNLDPIADTSVGSLEAAGAGLRLSDSVTSALGEAAERYCLYFPDRSSLVLASHDDLDRSGTPVVDFDYLSTYDDAQLEQVDLDVLTPGTPIRWQPARDLLSGETVYVPAQLVWMGLGRETGSVYYPTTSNGCACGSSKAMAALGALAEYVERDAVMRTWFRGADTRPIDLDGCQRLQRTLRRFETNVLSMQFFEMESPIDVQVVGCAAVDSQGRAPKVALGGACAIDRFRAYTSAMIEAAQTRVFLKELLAEGRSGADVDPGEIYNLRDNLLYYARPENFPDIEPLLGERTPTAPTLERRPDLGVDEELRAYLSTFRDADLTPLVVDVTTRDVRELGLTVVRVIVPELVGLALPSLPPADHPALADTDVTRKPHPYP